jgi:predicted NUDIX family NTP pyrophosphohydrolase
MIRPRNACDDGFCSEETTKSWDRQLAANARLHLAPEACPVATLRGMAGRSRISAGLLMVRIRDEGAEVLLVHPGGPFWANKDLGSWSIPKGESDDPDEDLLATARREFQEETGLQVRGELSALTPVRQKSGKIVHAWFFLGDCDPAMVRSNLFTMEWPPHSGRQQEFPEIDRAGFFGLEQAKQKIHAGLVPLLDELESRIGKRAD